MVASAQDGGVATRGVDMFNQCAEITSDSERLACFDRVTREMRATNRPGATASTPPPVGAAPRQQTAQQQREDFGLSAPKVQEKRQQPPSQLKQIRAKVAAVRQVSTGYWAILLEDGAIWKVAEYDVNYRPPRVGTTVTVRRGVMGGFLMYSDGQASIRVDRIS